MKDQILSLLASQELDIIKIVLNTTQESDQFSQLYPKLLKGLGCLKNLTTFKQILQLPQLLHHHPVAIRERLKQTLNEMEEIGIIRKVQQSTDCVNFLVVIEKPKSKKLCICLDPRPFNNAIRCDYFQLPTLEDITTWLSGAHVYT